MVTWRSTEIGPICLYEKIAIKRLKRRLGSRKGPNFRTGKGGNEGSAFQLLYNEHKEIVPELSSEESKW
jgi:hypothetical protein